MILMCVEIYHSKVERTTQCNSIGEKIILKKKPTNRVNIYDQVIWMTCVQVNSYSSGVIV
jgi:hypothetical protein